MELNNLKNRHRGITMFAKMDSLVNKVEESNNLELIWGSSLNENGILETSMYKEVSISGIIVTMKIYMQSLGDKVFYHSVSILDSIVALNMFSNGDEYLEFSWLTEELLEQVDSYIYYSSDYAKSCVDDIIKYLRESLLSLSVFEVNKDEPSKY